MQSTSPCQRVRRHHGGSQRSPSNRTTNAPAVPDAHARLLHSDAVHAPERVPRLGAELRLRAAPNALEEVRGLLDGGCGDGVGPEAYAVCRGVEYAGHDGANVVRARESAERGKCARNALEVEEGRGHVRVSSVGSGAAAKANYGDELNAVRRPDAGYHLLIVT